MNDNDGDNRSTKSKKGGGNSSTSTRKVTKNNSSSSSSSSSSYSSSSTGSSNWNTAKKQQVTNPDNVIRTDKGVYEFVQSRAWGTILVPVQDPSNIKVTYEEINGINLHEGFPKVPAHLWARWIQLVFHFCPDKPKTTYQSGYGGYGGYSGGYGGTTQRCWNAIEKRYQHYKWEGGKRVVVDPEPPKELRQSHGPHGDEHRPMGFHGGSSSGKGRVCDSGDLEVSCVFARKGPDFKEWRILVPKQKVSGGSVDADFSELCDIETGEVFEGFPPDWHHAGSSHSHNTMSAFFSATDDRSELGVPGLHIVVGSIKKNEGTYTYKASVVLRQLRKNVDLDDVVATQSDDDNENYTFHPKVLEMVTTKNYYGGGSTTTAPAKPANKSVSSKSSKPTKEEKEEEDFKAYWAARNDHIIDEEDRDNIECSPHYIQWRKRQQQKQKESSQSSLPVKTIGGGSNADEDNGWTDGTDDPVSNSVPLSDDDDTQTWGIEKVIANYENPATRTPVGDDYDWHGL